jgi:hypothetical protein
MNHTPIPDPAARQGDCTTIPEKKHYSKLTPRTWRR